MDSLQPWKILQTKRKDARKPRSAPIRSIITSHCRFRCVLIGTDAAPLCQTPMMPRASDDRLGLGRSAVVKCILKYSGQEPKLALGYSPHLSNSVVQSKSNRSVAMMILWRFWHELEASSTPRAQGCSSSRLTFKTSDTDRLSCYGWPGQLVKNCLAFGMSKSPWSIRLIRLKKSELQCFLQVVVGQARNVYMNISHFFEQTPATIPILMVWLFVSGDA